MRVILPSFAKINLTLRVVKHRADGYHDIVSAFLKIPSGEVLHISKPSVASDLISANINIAGENIVSKALRLARESGFKIPHLNVRITKSIPPGSGLGAGSGNAAAIIKFLGAEKVAAHVGSDVPFLCSGMNAALVAGVGDRMEKLDEPALHGLVAFPGWRTETGNAYSKLDEFLENKYRLDIMLAKKELLAIYSRVNAGKYVGFLPNDFSSMLVKLHPEYNELFKVFEKAGCIAWGITGSGSAAFALYKEIMNVKIAEWPSFVNDVLYF